MRNRSKNQITLVLIRHGATKSNLEHRYLGKTDEPLCKEGENQLEEYKRQNLYPRVDILYTSPMTRCIQTAKILYPDMQTNSVKEFSEMDFGTFEGKNYIELQADKRYQEWIDSNGTLPFPNGESREDFITRSVNGFNRINPKDGETIGMIVHGGTIMAILSQYYGGEYFDYQVANGKGYICKVDYSNTTPKITELMRIV
jgi:alpha-ribazole phosphatase